jgi:hypothetical protein
MGSQDITSYQPLAGLVAMDTSSLCGSFKD